MFLDIMVDIYRATTYTYIETSWAWRTWLWCILGLEDLNKNVFKSFDDLYEIFTFSRMPTPLSVIKMLFLDNRSLLEW